MTKLAALALLALLPALAMADGYRVRLDASLEGSRLTVAPRLTGPAGARVRYELTSTKEGDAGRSNTSQSGTLTVGADGAAQLSTLRLSVGPQDRYVISVKVFQDARVVASAQEIFPAAP